MRIICFGGAAVDASTWTNRQHIMTRLAERYPVLYIEPRLWVARSPRRWLRRRWRITMPDRQLFAMAQWNIVPGSREWRLISRLNHAINRWYVMREARRLGFIDNEKHKTKSEKHYASDRELIVWLYDTEAAEYLDLFPEACIVYDCVDDHAAQAGVDRNPRRVAVEEAAIMQRADLVTVTSQRLYELKRHQNSNVHLVLNAGDVTAYEKRIAGTPPELAALPRPIIGTVGTLDAYKFDFEMLRDIAARRPAWQFVLIGEPMVDARAARQRGLSELISLPNVHSLGSRHWRDVPRYVAAFDVCIIPYRNSRYNAASFPLKFWEFMASGKPIVAAGVPELRAYSTYIEYAENAVEFMAEIEQALRDGGAGRNERQALAREHSWEKRVEKLMTYFEAVLGDKKGSS